MTYMLKGLAEGKVVACLEVCFSYDFSCSVSQAKSAEGGYNLRSIARSALAVTRTLNGEMPPRLEDRAATSNAVETVQMVREYVSEYWTCIYPKPMRGQFIAR